VNRGFFSDKYELYGITNSETSTIVYRSQADFYDLGEALSKIHPGYIILPISKSPVKKLKSEYLNKRKTELQTFLSYLLTHPLFKRSNLLWKFLTLDDEKEFKEHISIQSISDDISQFTTLEGEARIYFDHSKENYCNEINIGIKQIQAEFKK